MEREKEYLFRYAKCHEGNCVVELEIRILKALWVAYIIHANFDPGTRWYDSEVKELYEAIKEGQWYDGDDPHWKDYDDFYEELSADLR